MVPHCSNLAAILNAAEVWGCNWVEILDAQVWAAQGEQAAPCLHYINKGGGEMLINESGLVRCIKRAYKSAGYAVAAEGDCMTIYTEQWYIQCKRAAIPRKVLATIVEHMGMIPDTEPVSIVKDGEPQLISRRWRRMK